jgi:hypothetical protein
MYKQIRYVHHNNRKTHGTMKIQQQPQKQQEQQQLQQQQNKN